MAEKSLAKARGFVVDEAGRPAAGVPVAGSVELADGRTEPLGVLASDTAGYVSFDLARAGNGAAPVRVHLTPVGDVAPALTFDLENKAPEAPFVLRVPAHDGPEGECGCGTRPDLPAVQSPDPVDWELSPGSFVTPRTITLGEPGCSVPVRSVLPTRRIGFVQIVRTPTAATDGGFEVSGGKSGRGVGEPAGIPGTSGTGSPPPGAPTDLSLLISPFEQVADAARPHWRPCEIVEYEQCWEDVGETLGNILYSLPLAPCESVNLAIIEASRSDQAARNDSVTGEEHLDHTLFRDRVIEETVDGTLRERQGGWSLMGGMAGSYSGSWANVGTFSAVHSLGGAVSHSWGNRKAHAESTQELHDGTVQATDVVRSLYSTVVVQASQTEQHRVETRTIRNHNHCHALTVQYYEVLRRVRLTTRYTRTRVGVLVPYKYLAFSKPYSVVEEKDDQMGKKYGVVPPPETDDLRLINRLRPQLEGSLLRRALEPNFEAVRRLLFFERVAVSIPPPDRPKGDYDLRTLIVKLTRGQFGTGSSAISLKLRLTEATGDGQRSVNYAAFDFVPGQYVKDSRDPVEVVLASSALTGDLTDEEDTAPVGPWTLRLRSALRRKLLAEFEIHWTDPPDIDTQRHDFTLRGLEVRTPTPDGEEVLVAVDLPEPGYTFQRTGAKSFPVAAPTTADPKTGDPKTTDPKTEQIKAAEQAAAQRRLDEALAWELIEHLHDHRDYYSQQLVAVKDSTWFAEALDRACGTSAALRERIDGLPVAVSGQFLAFPVNAAAPATSGNGSTIVRTDIVALPTRGVLAEAQLGSCNSCEKRDATRFWDWQESPCEDPPTITDISPGFKGKPPDLKPTELPQAVVQITQPPAAPDPAGLAALITLLGKGDSFRDMSGLVPLQQLLSGLASGAIDLAKAQTMARQVQQGATGKTGTTGTSGAGRAMPSESSADGQYDKLNMIKYAKEEGLYGPDQAADSTAGVLGGTMIPEGEGGSPAFEEADADLGHAKDWTDLICFQPPAAVLDALRPRDMSWQRLDLALGRLINLDNYQVRIQRMPVINGVRLDARGLVREYRRGLTGKNPLLVDGKAATFEPYESADGPRWLSDNPVGAVVYITIPWDDGAVVVSRADELSWTFSTVRTDRSGGHPISGNRQFGVRRSGDEHVLYARGADRPSGLHTSTLSGTTFAGGERLWLSLQQRVAAWINSHDGQATVGLADSERYSWVMVNALAKCPQQA